MQVGMQRARRLTWWVSGPPVLAHANRTPRSPAQARSPSSVGSLAMLMRMLYRIGIAPIQYSRPTRLGRTRRVVCGLAALVCSLAYQPCQADGEDAQQALRGAAERFARDVYPSIDRQGEGNCLDCHESDAVSNLVLTGDPRQDFQFLLDNHYLDQTGPDTFLSRLTTDNSDLRMPKGDDAESWSEEEIELLRQLMLSLEGLPGNARTDEQFPRELLAPYQGQLPSGLDNQFITYHQLQRKVAVIFGDDWRREGRDLFAENVALFGGADFTTRFNESSEPTASFFTALEMLSRDVAARAYERGTGPFADHPQQLLPPGGRQRASHVYRGAISRLYNALLFRPPAPAEIDQAYDLLRSVYAEQQSIAERDYDLHLELLVRDNSTGQQATQAIRVPVRGEAIPVYQQFIDQTRGEALPDANEGLVASKLPRAVRLLPQAEGQRLVLHNVATEGNVSFAGVALKPADGGETVAIAADDRRVHVEGSWEEEKRRGFVSFEDRDRQKGACSIAVPLAVPREGDYWISLKWRENTRNASQVLVDVFGPAVAGELAAPPALAPPPAGEAQFYYDSSEDARPFAELPGTYRFGEGDCVEISNRDTDDRVTASGVAFVPADGKGQEVFVDSKDAEGADAWSKFDAGAFRAYNTKGTLLNDDNEGKGERYLRFRPPASDKTTDANVDARYQVRIYYPGKRGNESRVPVIVRARESSPILRVQHSPLAAAGGRLSIDASSSFTLQSGPLEFRWRQTGGELVELPEYSRPSIAIDLPRKSIEQAAWVALAQALMRHPDFLFTRPPSVAKVDDPEIRERLQLVKIAQDLVGRAPLPDELERLAAGEPLASLVDAYLDSQEFRDYYFRRIRLYLESQGTELQDEPARLWCYVAFNDRPLQEILTADYTVDVDFQRQERPPSHGKTGVLTTKGFIAGKPGLPHFNYAAQVSMLFLGYVYEVPSDIVDQREGVTALGTADPNSVCYSCHKILTPLAFQRTRWTDDGEYRTTDEHGVEIDDSDRNSVEEYPFKGSGMEAFALQAVQKERFLRTMINTHFNFYFGRPMRHRADERRLYKELWETLHESDFQIRPLIRAIVTSDEYLSGAASTEEATAQRHLASLRWAMKLAAEADACATSPASVQQPLVERIRATATAIPAEIARAAAHGSDAESLQAVARARAALEELRTLLELADATRRLEPDQVVRLAGLCRKAAKHFAAAHPP